MAKSNLQLPLHHLILVYNIDRSPNEAGFITEAVSLILWYKNHSERTTFCITNLGKQKLILRHTWLWKHNPEINWNKGDVKLSRCPPHCCSRCRDELHQERITRCYSFEYSKDNPKNINSHTSSKPGSKKLHLSFSDFSLFIMSLSAQSQIDHSKGHAFLHNGTLYYSPNSACHITIPVNRELSLSIPQKRCTLGMISRPTMVDSRVLFSQFRSIETIIPRRDFLNTMGYPAIYHW